jgi:thimet oligopeptidase
MFRFILPTVLLTLAASAQDFPAGQPPLWSSKPDAAAFEKIENERLAAAQQAIDRITAVKGPRTVENTLAPFDEATQQLNAAGYFSGLMEQVHPDAAFRDRATAMTRKVSDAARALSLNRGVYEALAALDVSKADAATRYYVQRQLLEFRLAGVNKDDAQRARLRELNDQLTKAQSEFDRNISDDKRIVDVEPTDMDGLPSDYLARHEPGDDGKLHISTDYPDLFPVLTFAKNDNVRRKLYLASTNRGYPKNRAVLQSMMDTRFEIATLLGYKSWADYNAADKMVGNGARIAAFLKEVDAAARPFETREFNMLLAEYRKTHPAVREIPEYDRFYVPELLRRSQYDFDSQSVRPYFAYPRVKQGILDTAAKLFHVTFRQEQGVPGWDPSVETWDVLDNGKPIGRFYLDMHPRAGKYGHAEMAPLLDGIRGKQLPEAALVCNFPKPGGDDAGLMEYEIDVVAFFHEFGHLMHMILGGNQEWAGISGISMESDFVEAPSEMLEEMIRSPQVLAGFARQYQTNEPIPAALVAKMNRAAAFGRGLWVSRQNAYSAISYDYYKSDPQDVDVDSTYEADLRAYFPYTPHPDSHTWASFNHLGGYSSAYYTYLWDKVIALDFFSRFSQPNPLEGDAPMRYRRLVLEPGGSVSANDLVKNFLGRPQNLTAFKEWMGEEFAAQ